MFHVTSCCIQGGIEMESNADLLQNTFSRENIALLSTVIHKTQVVVFRGEFRWRAMQTYCKTHFRERILLYFQLSFIRHIVLRVSFM